jgi:uncharacterized protein (DUF305 family)
MTIHRRSFPILALLAPVVLAACGGGARSDPAPAGPAGMSAAEFEAIYRARTDSARMRFTDADVRFMTNMIHHHAQAIEMANLAPSRDASPSIRTLASRIINAQRDEIDIMLNWLRDRGQPVPETHITDTGVMVHGGGHHVHMPGMVTLEQLRQLGESRGREFDRQFLTLMIEHHRGAVTMVHELFATDGAGQDEDVFRFASDVQVDQATEVARMERMLSAMPGS